MDPLPPESPAAGSGARRPLAPSGPRLPPGMLCAAIVLAAARCESCVESTWTPFEGGLPGTGSPEPGA